MHFDFQVDNVAEMVKKAESLGAKKAESQFGGNDFVTMFDPAGHPFCLCRKWQFQFIELRKVEFIGEKKSENKAEIETHLNKGT